MNDFLDETIRNRIGVRLLAEQHIAITRTLQAEQKDLDQHHIGILDTACSPAEMIRTCAAFVRDMCESTFGLSPQVIIDGHSDATFA